MTFLISLAYIILTTVVCFYIYTWSATFKEMADFSSEDWDKITEEVNNTGREVDSLSESQKKILNYGTKILFLIIGCMIWSIMGITIGKIASSVTEHAVLKWFVYIGMYFLFLRIPFGLTNGMIESINELEHFPEKALFAIFMIGFYGLSICCYVVLPSFLKWHLFLLP